MAPDNWEITRRVFEEVGNQKNLKVVDELIAADYVHHDPSFPTIVSGIDGYKQFVTQYLTAFPDLHFTIEDHVSEGEMTASRWTVSGTHNGDLPSVPRTGRPISVTGIPRINATAWRSARRDGGPGSVERTARLEQ